MTKTFSYFYEDKTYLVEVYYKRNRNIYYRFKDGKFVITAPILTSFSTIQKGLDNFAPTLIKAKDRVPPFTENYIYLLGKRYEIISGYIKLDNGYNLNVINDLNKYALEVFKARTKYYEEMMSISPYNVRVRKMTSRYGVNSKKTNSITYTTTLIHYPLEVIDSVVVHELAHAYVFDHSKKFYDVVYKFYPNYKKYHTQLRKGIYHD